MTRPAANFQPHTVQYTPKDSNIDHRVPALVNPMSSSLPLVSARPTTATVHAQIFPSRVFFAAAARDGLERDLPDGGSAPVSTFSLRLETFAEIASCCREPGGRSSSASRQADRASATLFSCSL